MGSDLGNSILGFSALILPQCGYSGLVTIILFILGSLFANTGVHIDTEKRVNSQPSDNTLRVDG